MIAHLVNSETGEVVARIDYHGDFYADIWMKPRFLDCEDIGKPMKPEPPPVHTHKYLGISNIRYEQAHTEHEC